MALGQCRTGKGKYKTKAEAVKALGTNVRQCGCCRLWGPDTKRARIERRRGKGGK